MNKSLWRHFGLLAVVVSAYVVASYALMWHAKAPARIPWSNALWAALLDAPSSIATYIALAAGIAAGTASHTTRSLRGAGGVLVVSVALMIAIDMWISPLSTIGNQRAARAQQQAWPLPDDTIIYSPADTVGRIRTAIRILQTQPVALHEPLGSSWSADNPRMLAADAAVVLPHLLLPFITMGLALGAASWQRRRVLFRSPRDEVLARWCTAWVLAPAAWTLVLRWTSINYAVLHQTSPYWWPVALYTPFLIVAALGWRSATADRDVA